MCRVATALEHVDESLQVGNRVEVGRKLVGADTSVEVAADADVLSIACQLANVNDVVDEIVERLTTEVRIES